ncbi:hypothetical protein JHK82_048384 [Glycine max]|nr:hypothetical protein JHK82_048384 [Glycine max]
MMRGENIKDSKLEALSVRLHKVLSQLKFCLRELKGLKPSTLKGENIKEYKLEALSVKMHKVLSQLKFCLRE